MSFGWTAYIIRNSKNGKGYTGLTSKHIERRLSEHVAQAFPRRRNPNGTLYALHAALQKYGPECFTVCALEEGLNLDQARQRERDFIQQYSTYGRAKGKRGYNQTLGGEMPDEGGYENRKIAIPPLPPKQISTSPPLPPIPPTPMEFSSIQTVILATHEPPDAQKESEPRSGVTWIFLLAAFILLLIFLKV